MIPETANFKTTFRMKLLYPFLLLFLTSCEVEDSSTDKRDPVSGEANILTVTLTEERLRMITIPHVTFDRLPFREALEILQRYSADLSPDKMGISFVVDHGSVNDQGNRPGDSVPLLDKPVSLNLKNAPLSDALSATAEQVDFKYVMEPYAIKFVPVSTPDLVYITKEFSVPFSLLEINPQDYPDPFADPSSNSSPEPASTPNVKKVLEGAGITFPGEAMVVYNPKSGLLIVRNTEDQMELIESFIEWRRKPAD